MKKFFRVSINYVILLEFLLLLAGTFIFKDATNGNVNMYGLLSIFAVLVIATFLFKNKVILKRIPKRISVIGIIILLIYQILVVYSLSTKTGFDTVVMMMGASNKLPTSGYFSNYFAYYPNNITLLVTEKIIFKLSIFFGINNFELFLNFCNLIFMDTAMIIIVKALKYCQSGINNIVNYIIFIAFFISPWSIIFYSDTLVLPFVSAVILFMFRLQVSYINFNLKLILINSISLTFFVFVSYIVKPSTIIIVIATFIEYTLLLFDFRNLNKVNIKMILKCSRVIILCLFFFSVLIGIKNYAISNQNLVRVSGNLKMEPSHFVMMGLNKSSRGGFSENDFYYSARYKTLNSQNKANKKIIKKRLKNFGLVGYVKFAIEKNFYNTADGTFGWGKEGNFIQENFSKFKVLRSIFYPNGTRIDLYESIAQVVWVLTIIGLLMSFMDNTLNIRILRLSIFGLLLFLIIFEGGRSRYIIQFLPLLIIVSVRGWTLFLDRYKQLTSFYK